MKRIKVAHITTVDSSLRYLLMNQLVSISEAGYEVVGISTPGFEVPILEAAGIGHIPVWMTRNFTPLRDLRALSQLYRVFRNGRFTIIHTHTPKAGFLGQIAAKLAGTPIVVNTVHGFYFHDHMRPTLRRFYITLEKISARCSDGILSQNSEDIKTAVREGICPYGKIKYLGNGIDVRWFNPTNPLLGNIIRARTEVGVPVRARVVGFVGRLVREKGLLELFAAARLVRREVPEVHFIVVGPIDDHKRNALSARTGFQYGISDICHFLGMRQDMAQLYAMMDVFVLPSHREGFPRAPMEASAMKVPCVVTNIRGCREVVEHNRNGLLVNPDDLQALADAIIELLTDRKKAKRMGEEGRRMALERFDERLVFEKVKAEYARLLREKELPVPEPRPE